MPAPDASPFSLRLTAEQRRSIEQLAARERVSAEEAIVRAVERALGETAGSADAESGSQTDYDVPAGTPFHGLEALIASTGAGPEDLSTNPAYRSDLGRRS